MRTMARVRAKFVPGHRLAQRAPADDLLGDVLRHPAFDITIHASAAALGVLGGLELKGTLSLLSWVVAGLSGVQAVRLGLEYARDAKEGS